MTAPLRLAVRRSVAPQSGGLDVEISLNVPSDLGLVEEAVDIVARHCLTGALPPRHVRFNLRTALAEALGNAMVHGNGADPGRLVAIRVELRRSEIRVHVTDEGPGFDVRGQPDPTAPGNVELPAGRGLFLMRQLVDDVMFNAQGNSVCLTLRRP